MSEATPGPDPKPAEPEVAGAASADDFVKIVPLPKIVFFWPTALCTMICGIMMSIAGNPTSGAMALSLGWSFMGVFTFNILVISFDFPGIKFLLAGAVTIAMILGGALVNINFPSFFPDVLKGLSNATPVAFAHFYFFMTSVLLVVIIVSWLTALFTDVWYLHSNELVHKRGILGDVEKYPTINLRVTKEINDVFEFILLSSGALVLQPTTTDRPIVLENVPRINHKEKRIRDLLSKWRIDAT